MFLNVSVLNTLNTFTDLKGPKSHVIYRDFTSAVKLEKKKCWKKYDIFLMYLFKIFFRPGVSNVYPQSIFWRKNKKKIGISQHISVLLYNTGVERGYICHGHVFMMEL